MNKVYIPEGYRPVFDNYDTQRAIAYIKENFQEELAQALHLKRVSAPLFVTRGSGLNDDLSGVERPVSFDVPAIGKDAQVVHSLAKWKRLALKEYGFKMGQGLYTDMNAIRRDEQLDNIHSIYVDQWDWEKIIDSDSRNTEYLKKVVRAIAAAISNTHDKLCVRFPQLKVELSRQVQFITSQELYDMYPNVSAKERENAYTKEHGTVFIIGIGAPLTSGMPHDKRAPDYDDWSLNGDLLYWDETLGCALEISSMGIRVDREAMLNQLEASGCMERCELLFHKKLIAGELPLTIGGGIGQSRLCMLMMGCAHIGEVQSSIWDDHTYRMCDESNIRLL